MRELHLNNLFMKMWKQGDKNWNSTEGNNFWKSQCLLDRKGWVNVMIGAHEYLGYCDEKNKEESVEALSFLDVNKLNEDGKKIEISLCQQDCWLERESLSGIQMLKTPKNDNWKKVEFYKVEK